MICVEDTVVGSRLATKRICKTKEEWKQERLDSRQFLEKATNSQTNPVG
jgi:methionine synthase II (cobalamin-independent)